MNAKELLQEWKERCNRLPRTAEEEDYQTILRALSLLAAIEDASGPTPETDAEFQLSCKGAVAKDRLEKFSSRSLWDFARRLEQERNAALRALDQERRGIEAAQTNQDDSLDRWIARAKKAEAEVARLKAHAEAMRVLLIRTMPKLTPADNAEFLVEIQNATCNYRRDYPEGTK